MTATIRLIIAGSRTVDPTDAEIDSRVDELWCGETDAHPGDLRERGYGTAIIEVICGKADGADRAGERWARARGITVHSEPVTEDDRQRWGPYLAPKMRNRRLADRGTHAICFWDCLSGGTPDLHARMCLRGKPSLLIPTKKRPTKRRNLGGAP